MSVTILVELKIKTEAADLYAVRLRSAFPETRAYEGCQQIVAYRDSEQPERFVIVERWLSRAHYDRYIQWRRSTGTFDKLAAISDAPMSVRFLDVAA